MRKSKIALRLESLIEVAQARLKLEEPGAVDKRERKAVLEEHEIGLIEEMDKLSRLIDPEHSHYEGDS